MTYMRTIIFVTAAERAAALVAAQGVSQPSLALFPLCPASGPATATATFYGASGRLDSDPKKEPQNAATLAAAAPTQFPSAIWWRGEEIDAQTITVAESSIPGDVGKRLSFAQMLDEAGLQRQQLKFP